MGIKFVGFEESEGIKLHSRFVDLLSKTPVELGHTIATDVTVFPKKYFHSAGSMLASNVGLFSSDGDLITDSCLIRGNKTITQLPLHISKLERLEKKNVKGTYLYGGFLANHYGHVLTEAVSRLWYLSSGNPVDGVVFCGAQEFGKTAQSIFKEIGLGNTYFIMPQEVMRFDRIIIPQPSMINLLYVHEQHRKIFTDSETVHFGLKQTQRPLYLSRRLLKRDNRHVVNESHLENFLINKGIRVEHPQYLSLSEQVRLVNEHEIIIGLSGSALHTTLFAKTPKKILHLSSSVINMNFPLLDNACKNESVYLNCVKGAKGEANIDIEKVWSEIEVMLEEKNDE